MTVRAIRERSPARGGTRGEDEGRGRARPAPWAPPTIALARVRERAGEAWIVEAGGRSWEVGVDPSVDPALVVEAAALGARVVVEGSTVVGVISTRRAIHMDHEGRVDAEVTSFALKAREELLLKTPGAFVRAKAREIEIYGDRVLTRARDVAKILAAMIKLN